ncbi:MAG: hypothetical protein AAFY72_06130, partial [Cyanobacteria bacterium J06649_4]
KAGVWIGFIARLAAGQPPNSHPQLSAQIGIGFGRVFHKRASKVNAMSTNDENGTSKSASNSSTRTRKKATATTSAKSETASKGGLVKAPKSEIVELADHTRVVESESLPNHRPIALSEVEVVDSLSSAGVRPVMADSFEISTTDSLPGHRPVAVSTLVVSDIDTLPGHRPIASNDIDEDPTILMGYLD